MSRSNPAVAADVQGRCQPCPKCGCLIEPYYGVSAHLKNCWGPDGQTPPGRVVALRAESAQKKILRGMATPSARRRGRPRKAA